MSTHHNPNFAGWDKSLDVDDRRDARTSQRHAKQDARRINRARREPVTVESEARRLATPGQGKR